MPNSINNNNNVENKGDQKLQPARPMTTN